MAALAMRAALFAILLVFESNAEIQCQAGAIDLVFVIDQSGSVGEKNFVTGLEAAVDLTNTLDIGNGNDQSRVGLVLFNSSASVSFNLDKFLTKERVASELRNVKYHGGEGTDIASGMDVAIKQIFQRKGRSGVPRVMIIITDGQDSSDVKAEQSQAKESHITTYAVGVGADVDVAELEVATGDKNRVYKVSDYSQLSKVMSLICKEYEVTTVSPPNHNHHHASCKCDNPKTDYLEVWLDIIVILDSSYSMGGEEFNAAKNVISSIVSYYQIGSNAVTPGKFARVAVINNGAAAQRVANLTTYTDARQLAKAIRAVKQLGGTFDPLKGLNEAVAMLEEEQEARRRLNVRKAIILISTLDIHCTEITYSKVKGKQSQKSDNDNTCRLASELKGDNVNLITVAVKEPGKEGFPDINIADKCNRLNNDQSLTANLMGRLCLANCYCLPPYTQYTVNDKCEKYSECVFVHGMSTVYETAHNSCEDEGDRLTDILSDDKNQFLKGLHLDATFYPFWVGGKYASSGISWDSGVQGDPSDYTNWFTYPDSSKGECIAHKQIQGFKTGWVSEDCGFIMSPAYYFSCQRPSCTVKNYCEK